MMYPQFKQQAIYLFFLCISIQLSAQKWNTQTCSLTNCKVDFPVSPKEGRFTALNKTRHIYTTIFKKHEFELQCTIHSQGLTTGNDAVAKFLLNSYLTLESGELKEWLEGIDIGNQKGVGMYFTNAQHDFITCVFIRKNIIYQLIVKAPVDDLNKVYIDTFFNSFQANLASKEGVF